LNDGPGREQAREVILVDRVREAAVRPNPGIPPKAIEDALEKLLDRRQAMSLVAANQEVYGLLRDVFRWSSTTRNGGRKRSAFTLSTSTAGREPLSAVTQLGAKRARLPPARRAALTSTGCRSSSSS
jgi:type I restriction enzyme R subunit